MKNTSIVVRVLAVLLISGAGHAALRNPLIAPAPSVKVEQEKAASTGGKASQTNSPQLSSALPGPLTPAPSFSGLSQQQSLQTPLVFPPEKWLAEAIVTSTVGDRASILVPTSLNAAQAANSTTGQQGMQNQTIFMQMPRSAQGPVDLSQPTASTGQTALAGPQTATQVPRSEVLYVQTGVPFFFRGERFFVDVKGREVTIFRPKKPNEPRDIVFVGYVSATELVRKPNVGTFAAPDPAVQKLIAPVYSGSNSTTAAAPGAAGSGTGNGSPK